MHGRSYTYDDVRMIYYTYIIIYTLYACKCIRLDDLYVRVCVCVFVYVRVCVCVGPCCLRLLLFAPIAVCAYCCLRLLLFAPTAVCAYCCGCLLLCITAAVHNCCVRLLLCMGAVNVCNIRLVRKLSRPPAAMHAVPAVPGSNTASTKSSS